VLNDADIALFSVWRRTPPKPQMDVIRKFVTDGKPIVGIRTACHAFAKRDGKVAPGHAAWPAFDREVLGGNYRGHFGGETPSSRGTIVTISKENAANPLLQNVSVTESLVTSWLYKVSPVEPCANVLLMGRVDRGAQTEPVAWTFQTSGGGHVFYTSLGHPKDFELAWFQNLLANGIYWAAGLADPATN
jgi:type 1 glutamine amidotransferase